jgi:hypothetical protein
VQEMPIIPKLSTRVQFPVASYNKIRHFSHFERVPFRGPFRKPWPIYFFGAGAAGFVTPLPVVGAAGFPPPAGA